MARKKAPAQRTLHDSREAHEIIQDAGNIVRWNIPLAIEIMDRVKNKVWYGSQIRQYNRTAKSINEYLDSVEKCRFYTKKQFWTTEDIFGVYRTLAPMRLDLMEDGEDFGFPSL